jgi:MFS-type transporter involved in bile tolerance (Atg22 family)
MSEQALRPKPPGDWNHQAALRFVVLVGVCSLFCDMTYEGARSINGSFLADLGASGFVVGIVAGFGELIGYGLRLGTGYLADRSRRYWPMVFVGAAVNVLAVPLVGLATSWHVAAAWMITERIGKAIRTPARDVVLSQGTRVVGHGFGFGLHEALDQIGAVAGPLLVFAVMAGGRSFRAGYGILAIPAALTMVCVWIAWLHRPSEIPVAVAAAKIKAPFDRRYWLAIAAAACIATGYADFPLIAFHLERTGAIAPASIPLCYAIAMGVDAIAALVPEERRGTAFGVFNGAYGLAWFAGSALMGWMYDRSIVALVVFSVVFQLLALPLLFATVWRQSRLGNPNP